MMGGSFDVTKEVRGQSIYLGILLRYQGLYMALYAMVHRYVSKLLVGAVFAYGRMAIHFDGS
jgi:hypothetical protein